MTIIALERKRKRKRKMDNGARINEQESEKKIYKQLKRNSGNWQEEQTSNKSTSAVQLLNVRLFAEKSSASATCNQAHTYKHKRQRVKSKAAPPIPSFL